VSNELSGMHALDPDQPDKPLRDRCSGWLGSGLPNSEALVRL
jgi:hypothetical protein